MENFGGLDKPIIGEIATPKLHMTRGAPMRMSLAPNSKNALMVLSIVPLILILALGLVFAPAFAITLLTLGVSLGWLPVIIGFVKTQFKARAPADDRLDTLPMLTILIPLYKEANMVGQIAEMLKAIEYPEEKLECLILIEADDRPTAIAAMLIDWPDFVRITTVPDGHPRTKARACNYGMDCSQGELVVIFDAEDMPHPQQMREAAEKFATADNTLACLQAPLSILPQNGSWLQAQFALEYRLLFSFILPNLSEAISCLPLGGSSNYFRRAALEHVGGWDAYNLTEDADLAMRFAGHNYRIGTLRHETLENAPHRYLIWHAQRTRWLSGHIQLLHSYGAWTLRNGLRPAGAFKWSAAMLACIMVLGVRLVSGLLFIIGGIVLMTPRESHLSPYLICASIGSYLIYSLVLLCYAPSDNWADKFGLVLSHPFYWALTFLANLSAIKRMALGEVNWLKSPHQPYPKS
jgi:glycosyltransferase XagB